MLLVIGTLGAIVLAVTGAAALGHMVRCHDKHCRCPLIQRWFAGRSLNGHTLWDSTFLREGRNVLTQTKHASPFQKLAGWERRAWRAAPVAAGAAAAAWFRAPALAAGLAAALAALSGYRVIRWTHRGDRVRRWLAVHLRWPRRHRGSRVQPMAQALATITGTAPGSVQPGITWNPDYATAGPGERVATWAGWPPAFKAAGKERAAVEDLWRSRVGFDLVFEWRTSIPEPELVMTRAREMPKLVLLSDVLDQIAALPDDKSAIGFDDHARMVCWDWKNESPHALVNAGSRHGKTELEEGLICQELRRGGDATVVDVKRVSLQGLQGLPGLTLKDNPRDMAGMWDAIVAWGRDLDDRIDARVDDPTVQFRRSLLVIEEVNQFDEMCTEFWENLTEEDPDTWGTIFWKPKRAKRTPAIWKVIKQGVWEGAFVKKNVIIVGQNIEAQTVKGVRNSIGMRLLGGYQPQNWKALVGTTPVPPAPPQKGRWCLINGSTQTWVQAVIADPVDANNSAAIWRDYARAGRRMDGTMPVTDAPVTYHVDSGGQVSAVNGATPGHVTAAGPMGLSDIVAAGLVAGTVKALRMDRHRSDLGELPDGLTFPEPVGRDGQKELFDVTEVQAFDVLRRKLTRQGR